MLQNVKWLKYKWAIVQKRSNECLYRWNSIVGLIKIRHLSFFFFFTSNSLSIISKNLRTQRNFCHIEFGFRIYKTANSFWIKVLCAFLKRFFHRRKCEMCAVCIERHVQVSKEKCKLKLIPLSITQSKPNESVHLTVFQSKWNINNAAKCEEDFCLNIDIDTWINSVERW